MLLENAYLHARRKADAKTMQRMSAKSVSKMFVQESGSDEQSVLKILLG